MATSRLQPARAAAVLLSALVLLFAQLLLVAHAHPDGHGHGDGDIDATCTVCVFKAAGHGQLAPLKSGAAMALLPKAGFAVPAAPAQRDKRPEWRFCKQARGPPSAIRTA